VGVDRHEVPTLAVDARLLRSAGDARVRALAIPARAAMVGVRVGIDAGVPAGDERDGARQGAGPADADLTRGADLASAPRAVSAALGRAAVAPIGVRVHAGAVAHDERSRAGDHALARDADLAGIACGPGRPTVLAAAFGRPAVLAVALGIDAGAAAFDETRLAGERAPPGAADFALLTRFAGAPLPVFAAARRGAAVVAARRRVDTRVVAFHEPVGTRQGAGARVAHVAGVAGFAALAAALAVAPRIGASGGRVLAAVAPGEGRGTRGLARSARAHEPFVADLTAGTAVLRVEVGIDAGARSEERRVG